MDIEEAVALMIQHRIRRLPVTSGDDLVGIVTIDDLAVRAGRSAPGAADHRRGGQGGAAGVLLPPARRLMAPLTPGQLRTRAAGGRRDPPDGARARRRAGGGRPRLAAGRARGRGVLPAARVAPAANADSSGRTRRDTRKSSVGGELGRPPPLCAFLAAALILAQRRPRSVRDRGPPRASRRCRTSYLSIDDNPAPFLASGVAQAIGGAARSASSTTCSAHDRPRRAVPQWFVYLW